MSIHGGRRRVGYGWWTNNAIYGWCVAELYTYNLYNFIDLLSYLPHAIFEMYYTKTLFIVYQKFKFNLTLYIFSCWVWEPELRKKYKNNFWAMVRTKQWRKEQCPLMSRNLWEALSWWEKHTDCSSSQDSKVQTVHKTTVNRNGLQEALSTQLDRLLMVSVRSESLENYHEILGLM